LQVHDRVRRQPLDEIRGCRASAWAPRLLAPDFLKLDDPVSKSGRGASGLLEGTAEEFVPVLFAAVAEARQPLDVVVGASGQHEANGRQHLAGHTAAAKDGVDERAADAAVPVVEGVDRLEL